MTEQKKQHSAGEGSIKKIHRQFNGQEVGWNGINWLIELEQPIQVNIGRVTAMTEYFVASNIVDTEDGAEQRTTVFPTNDLYHPLKHRGVVAGRGWTLKKAMVAFREYLEQRPDVRAMQEVEP